MSLPKDEICPECGSDRLTEHELYFECDECGFTWNKDEEED